MKIFWSKKLFFSAIAAMTTLTLSAAASGGDPFMVVVEQEAGSSSVLLPQRRAQRRRKPASRPLRRRRPVLDGTSSDAIATDPLLSVPTTPDGIATSTPSSAPVGGATTGDRTAGVECNFVHCDFSTLQVASYLSNAAQSERLLLDCGIISVTADKDGQSRNVNVFDSANLSGRGEEFDSDLGSPNKLCPIPGPGRGRGGEPDSEFANCNPQGNLLIIQNKSLVESIPNDDGDGGCMYIKFQNMVNLYDMGLLDMEDPMTIAVRLLFIFSTNTSHFNLMNLFSCIF
jgi:hypothetical protein